MELFNDIVYPPRDLSKFFVANDEFPEAHPAEVTYMKENMLYSRKKLWLHAIMVYFNLAAFDYL